MDATSSMACKKYFFIVVVLKLNIQKVSETENTFSQRDMKGEEMMIPGDFKDDIKKSGVELRKTNFRQPLWH